jgi:hypothetical protein
VKLFRRKNPRKMSPDVRDALAAKITADIEHKAALDRLHEAERQKDTIDAMNNRNHFSEGLHKAFRARPL